MTCPTGTVGQWSSLTYKASGAAGTKISLRAMTALSGWKPIVTNIDPANCTGVGAGCPVDLYNILGKIPNAQSNPLTIEWTLTSTPGQGACPTMSDIEVSYSCPDGG